MARPRYRITPQDHWFARRWVEKKLADPGWLGAARAHAAQQDWQQREETTTALNDWCERWLTSEQWTQMKNAIRASRRRARGTDDVTVTLSRYAWSILEFWARREGCTLSEVIERRLGHRR